MAEILLAHAPAAAHSAARVTQKLAALGYRVKASQPAAPSPQAQQRLDRAVASAACVLVLWSRDAARTPGLLTAAKCANAARKLAVARLDSSAAPLRVPAANLSAWKGRMDARSWRRLVARLPKAQNAVPQARRGVSQFGTTSVARRHHRWIRAVLALGVFTIGALAAAAAALRYLPQGQ